MPWGYLGGGTYSTTGENSTSAGTISEHGDSSSSSDYSIDFEVANGLWITSSGTSTGTSHSDGGWSYQGEGGYFTLLTDGSVSGTTHEWGGIAWNSDSEWTYTLDANDEWVLSGGTGLDTGSWWQGSDYQGHGNYGATDTWGSVAGTITESGSRSISCSYHVDYGVVDGAWTQSGWADFDKDHHSFWSYDGSGGYAYGGIATYGGSSSSDGWVHWHETMDNEGVWSLAGGNGQTESHDLYGSSFEGHGTYSREDGVSGTIDDSGGTSYAWDYTEDYAVAGGVWETSGQGDGSASGSHTISWDGGKGYTRGLDTGGTITGAYHESGSMGTSYSYGWQNTANADGTRSYSGGGYARAFSDSQFDFSGSGTASWGGWTSTFEEGGDESQNYEYRNNWTMGADGVWHLDSTRVVDGGGGMVWTSYTYNGSSSQSYDYRNDIYDEFTNEVIAWEIHSGNTITSSSDSINRSNGYSFSRDATLTYNEGSMPTITGTGSGNTWTHETNSHSASTDNATHWWIGNDEGNSWMDSEYHVSENWSGGSHSRREWTEDYSAGTGPVTTVNTSDSYGSGTRMTNGSITFGGTGEQTQTTTFPEVTEELGGYGGGSGPGAMFGLRDVPMGGLPAGLYDGGYIFGGGPLCDENGVPIMLAAAGSPQDAIAAAAGATTRPATTQPAAVTGPFRPNAVYQMNRSFGNTSSNPRSGNNPLSHTFTFTTDANGQVAHTYSWGNTANLKGWNIDQREDIRAANKGPSSAVLMGVGLTEEVDAAYQKIKSDRHANWVISSNCKMEANRLLVEACKIAFAAGKMPSTNVPDMPQQ